MTITNPENKLLPWKIDTSKLNKTFGINPSSGRIDGGQSIVIKISFNPLLSGEYHAEVPLYLDNYFDHPYTTIKISGNLFQLFYQNWIKLDSVDISIEMNAL